MVDILWLVSPVEYNLLVVFLDDNLLYHVVLLGVAEAVGVVVHADKPNDAYLAVGNLLEIWPAVEDNHRWVD